VSKSFMKFWHRHERRLDQCLQLRQFEEKFRNVSSHLLIVYPLNRIAVRVLFICVLLWVIFCIHIHLYLFTFMGHNRWRGGATGKAFGLAISRSQGQILLGATLRNNLRQVVYTYVPLSPSSITCYRPKGGDALRLWR